MRPSTWAKGGQGGTQEVGERILPGQGTGLGLTSSCHCHKLVQARWHSNRDSLSSRLEGWKSTIGSPEKRSRGQEGCSASSLQEGLTQEPILVPHLLRPGESLLSSCSQRQLRQGSFQPLHPGSSPFAGFFSPQLLTPEDSGLSLLRTSSLLQLYYPSSQCIHVARCTG